MTAQPDDGDFLAAARLALGEWGIEPREVAVVSRSENVVCRVDSTETGPLILRLHRPGYNSEAELRSEVQWVDSLAAAGIPVPRARATPDGRHHVAVPVADEVRHVGLIEWVDGSPLGAPIGGNDPRVSDKYRLIGEVAARIRCHSIDWQPPADFRRRRWDAEGLVGPDPVWGRFWQVPNLNPGQRELFAAARADLFQRLAALSTDSDRFGLIHADLHLGNLMADDDQLTVIDFDDSGYGWFAHELAVTLHPVFDQATLPDARRSLIEGYRTVFPLSDEEARSIDLFLVVRSLMLVGWLAARPEVPVYRHFSHLARQAELVTEHFLQHGQVEGWNGDGS